MNTFHSVLCAVALVVLVLDKPLRTRYGKTWMAREYGIPGGVARDGQIITVYRSPGAVYLCDGFRGRIA